LKNISRPLKSEIGAKAVPKPLAKITVRPNKKE